MSRNEDIFTYTFLETLTYPHECDCNACTRQPSGVEAAGVERVSTTNKSKRGKRGKRVSR